MTSTVFPEHIASRIHSFPFVVPPGITEETRPFNVVFDDLDPHTPMMVQVPGSKAAGYSAAYRNVLHPQALISSYHPHVKTYYDAFELALKDDPDYQQLGTRERLPGGGFGEYQWLTYRKIDQIRTSLGAAIRHLVGVHAQDAPESFVVTLFGPNSANWVLADLACVCQNLPNAVLYETLGPGTSEYILNVTDSPICFATTQSAQVLLKLQRQTPRLKVIVVLDYSSDVGPLLKEWAASVGIGLYGFDEAVAIGSENHVSHRPPRPTDLYAIVFTSGTTGNPKGVQITHEVLTAFTAWVKLAISSRSHYNSATDPQFSLSFLPLAHISERGSVAAGISLKRALAFPHGSVFEIGEDFPYVKPTFVSTVPRLANRMAQLIKQATLEAPGLKGALSRRAFRAKLAHLRATGSPHHAVWDKLWSSAIRKKLGFDRVGIMISGSAPLAPDTVEFLKAALSVEVVQGYGLTESCSGVCISVPKDEVPGHVGPVGSTCEIRLRDLPDMGYTSENEREPCGEIMFRGPQIFKGYYKEEAKTLEAFDEDGWFHTGDVGKIDEFGRIFIVDRVKNFFKLAQGEYVGPEKIEGVYQSATTLLNQIFIYGDSFQTYLVGILGVNPETYAVFASSVLGQNFSPDDVAALTQTFSNPKIRRAVLRHLNEAISFANLYGFEKLKNLHLKLEPLSIASDTLTPTLKVRRDRCAKVFQPEIEAMYAEGVLEGESKL